MFWLEYSYLGLDPRAISFHGKSYFEHFQNFCAVEVHYAEEHRDQFAGYGPLWGWTAGYGPDGYKEFSPGLEDNGTINPTAALSAMPYAPEAALRMLTVLYTEHGRETWGPYGFYDGFNLSRHWFARDYLDDGVGPIAPMIENHLSGLGWRMFMKAPEMAAAVRLINHSPGR